MTLSLQGMEVLSQETIIPDFSNKGTIFRFKMISDVPLNERNALKNDIL